MNTENIKIIAGKSISAVIFLRFFTFYLLLSQIKISGQIFRVAGDVDAHGSQSLFIIV